MKGKNYELDLRLDQQDKKEDTMKRLLSMLLVVTLVALMATPAYAQVGQKEEAIDENVATTLAMLFVGSNLKDETSWNMKTDILDTVPLYNSENEISAYCIKLKTGVNSSGYVVVSADMTKPLIQEYSTECVPIFETQQFNASTARSLNGNNTVYYGGPLNYASKAVEVAQEENATNSVDVTELTKNNEKLIQEIVNTGTLAENQNGVQRAGKRISDPLEYLHELYPSWTFNNAGYYNMGENAIAPYLIKENNACAMYAISAILKYKLGNAYTFTSIKNTVLQLFRNSSFGKDNPSGDYYLENGEYTRFTNICLAHYGLRQSASSSLDAWGVGKIAISQNRPVMLNIWSAPGGNYSNHTVTAYAWTQFVTVSTNLHYQFFKVRDGYTTSNVGRYVYFGSMAPAYVTTV